MDSDVTDLQSTSNPDPADVRLRAAGLDSRPSGCSHRRPLPTQRMFGAVPLVWICNPDPLSIRIFNPPGNNVLSQNNTCGNKTATSSLSFLLMMIKNGIQNHSTSMADKYPSISPYAYCAWNPVKLIDPDGREIDISSFFDENGKVKQDCLFAYKALSYFANTRFGYRALALFAKKGQKIAGREFTEDGLYHQDGIDLSFRVGALSNGRSASGETGTEITGRGKSRRMRITISLCTQVSGGERTNVPSYLETICHEMFFHAFIFAEDYTDDVLINDSQISPALKSCAYRNDRQELQDLDYNLRYRNYAIPIMTEYFKGQKTVAQTIDWMSKQGQNFIHRPNWHKTR